MEYILSVLWVTAELLCCMFFCGAFLERRKSRIAPILIWMFGWLSLMCGAYFLQSSALRQVVSIGIVVITVQRIYKGNLLTHLLLTLICYIFVAAIDTVFSYGTCLLLGIDHATFVWQKWNYTAVISISKSLACLLMFFLFRIRKRKRNSLIQGKWLLLMSLFPMTSVIMFLVLLFSGPGRESASGSIFIFSCILIVSNAAILYVLEAVETSTSREQEVRLLNRQIALQTDMYHVLEKNYALQRKATHEFERHIQALQDLIDTGSYETAGEYLKRLHNSRALQTFSIRSNHPVFDVILNQKHQFAQEQNIVMSVTVNDLSSVSISTDLLVVLLSNLLDNAIEACLRLENHREIVCKIVREESLFLSIRNTSVPVEMVEGRLPATSKDPLDHGYGLGAVVYTLDQLKAEYTYSYQNGWFQFAAEIPDTPD